MVCSNRPYNCFFVLVAYEVKWTPISSFFFWKCFGNFARVFQNSLFFFGGNCEFFKETGTFSRKMLEAFTIIELTF